MQNIVLCYPVNEAQIEQITQAAGPEYNIISVGQKEIKEAIFDADIFCGHGKLTGAAGIDWDAVVEKGRLQWIQSSAAGMDHCLVPATINSSIHVTSASGVLSDQVAEHTIALLTGWMRRLKTFVLAESTRDFTRRPTWDLTYRTVLIVGLGGVGRRLSELLRPFRGKIMAVDLFPDKVLPPTVDELYPADELDAVLPKADVVVTCLPLNQFTRKTFNAERFSKFKKGALFANMARGALVDHDAMVAALDSQQLIGAVMDVTDPEPLPPESPLWERPNVLITPHVAGQSRWRIENMTYMFCENLRRWKAGEPLVNYLTRKELGFPMRGTGHPLWSEIAQDIVPKDRGEMGVETFY